jgi:mRNA-degrading endonuclease RelE of RelBE toxin-antitoxin system
MEDAFIVSFDTRAIQDLKGFSSEIGRHLLEEIHEKLSLNPITFGKPLRNSLRGHRTLRMGDYRAIFRLQGKTVLVLTIRHRSRGYEGI